MYVLEVYKFARHPKELKSAKNSLKRIPQKDFVFHYTLDFRIITFTELFYIRCFPFIRHYKTAVHENHKKTYNGKYLILCHLKADIIYQKLFNWIC